MYVILLVWLTLAIPASPFCVHLTWEHGLAEVGFLKKPQDKQDDRQWKAGTYRGITIGKSTATELRQRWGEPKWSGHWEWDNPKNPEFLLYDYDAQDEFIFKIRVETETKTGKVNSIDISTDELPLSKAIELFGKDYIETWYESCNCEPGEASPIFESPDGNYRSIEYRSRGIAMAVDDQGRVISIQFVDKPIGFKSAKECETMPKCRPQRKSVRRKRI
jgi:hypothetical protein